MTKLSNIVAVDVETTGLNPRTDKLHGCGLASSTYSGYRTGRGFPLPLVKNIVGHNLRFDLKFLKYSPTDEQKIWDTRIMASLVNENEPLGLKKLSAKYLGTSSVDNYNELDELLRKLKFKSVAELCQKDLDEGGYTELIGRYCKEDCENTLALFHLLGKKLREVHKKQLNAGFKKTALDYLLEEAMPLERVLLGMENRGIRVNVTKLESYKVKLLAENGDLEFLLNDVAASELVTLEDELFCEQVAKRKSDKGKAGVKVQKRFNWRSGDHVGRLVYLGFDIRGLEKRTKTGKFDTSEKQLRSLQIECKNPYLQNLIATYLKWKKNLKLLTTYTGEKKGLQAHVVEGRVFAEYLQTGRGKEALTGGTVTGRLSSRSPNMQNLPRTGVVKEFFVPDTEGHVFVYFDYSQLELRIAAHLSQDPKLLAAYRDDLDLHQNTGTKLGIERQLGKKINFAMVYNASEWRLHAELKETHTLDQCRDLIRDFFEEYHVYKTYLERQKALMIKRGVVVSETGRVRRLPALLKQPKRPWSPEGKAFRHALNQGYNFPIQSLGASITKRAMLALHSQGFDLVTQVHDSVVLQVLKEEARPSLLAAVRTVAESVYPLAVPLKVDLKVLQSLNESDLYTGEEDARTTYDSRKLKIVS